MILEPTPEQRAVARSAENFAREIVAPQAAAIDESGDYPRDVMRAAGERGLMGLALPTVWGGRGLDYVSYVLAIEELARASAEPRLTDECRHGLAAFFDKQPAPWSPGERPA